MVPPPVPTTEAESGDPELKTAVDLEEEEIESDEYDSNFGEEEDEDEDEEEADEDADDEVRGSTPAPRCTTPCIVHTQICL